MPKRLVSSAVLCALLLSSLPLAPTAVAAGPSGKLVIPGGSNDGGFLIVEADGSSPVHLTAIKGHHPSWSPDGKRFAYNANKKGGFEDIFVVDADGRNERQVTATENAERYPDWSPDGSRIAFTRDGEIWTIKPDGTGETRVFSVVTEPCQYGDMSKKLRRAYDVAWSPDGSKFVLMGQSCYLTAALFVVGSDGTGDRMLDLPEVGFGGYEPDPEWSPDGKTIAFFGREYQGKGYQGLWTVSADGGPTKRISQGGHHPAWSPDGTEIAAPGAYGIHAIKNDGSGSREITNRGGAAGDGPDWVGGAPAPKSGFARFASTKLDFEKRIDDLGKRIKPQYDKLMTDRAVFEKLLATEKQRLDKAGLQQEAARKELKELNGRLDDAKALLGDGVTAEQSATLANLEADLKSVTDHWRDRSLEVNLATKSYTDYEQKLQMVQQKLVALAEPVSALDFDLEGVSVRAEDRVAPVYRWAYTDEWPTILEMTKRIQEQNMNVADLKTMKEAMFTDFVHLTRDATDKNIAVANMLRKHAYGRTAARLGKDITDVLKAAAEGHIPGALAEFAKKLVELSIENAGAGEVGNPNPGLEEVDAWFKGSLYETLKKDTKDLAYDKTVMDGIKDATIKDPVEGMLCPALYDKIDEVCASSPAELKEMAGKKVVERAKAMKAEIKRIAKRVAAFKEIGLRKGFLTFGKKSGKLLARKSLKGLLGIGQDVQEVVFNRIFDEREMAAWYAFNHADQLARQQWGLYVAASKAYYAANEDLENLTASKAKLLADWDKKTKQLVKNKDRFKVPQQVIVDVRYTRPKGSTTEPIPLEVYAGGIKAEPGPTMPWGRKYYFTKAQLLSISDAERENLALELR